MRSTPYTTSKPARERTRPTSRKKACTRCTTSKVRCDLKRPSCSRCRSFDQPCQYVTSTGLASDPQPIPSVNNSTAAETENTFSTPAIQWGMRIPSGSEGPNSVPQGGNSFVIQNSVSRPGKQRATGWRSREEILCWADIHLLSFPNIENIRDRWLRPYILPPVGQEEIPKIYQPFTIQYISRILSTYPCSMLTDGGVPPYIHQSQVSGKEMPESLANCYSLVRMWMQAAPGSEGMVLKVVQDEMFRLEHERYEDSRIYDYECLCAFQAYLTYTIMLYFSTHNDVQMVDDNLMMTLMELAFRSAQGGLHCITFVNSRPTWESWIISSAKRRAIFTMYFLSSVYNSQRHLPNFIADEMRGVHVPEGRSLWEASDREQWSKEFDRHMICWEDGFLEISELWKSEATGTVRLRKRIERWIQTVDEFGMTLFAVCSHTHGC